MTENQKMEMCGKLEPFFKLNQQWQDLILGGSLALMLQNAIPYRSGGDIDLVGHKYNVFDNQTIRQLGSSVDDADCVMITIDNSSYDFFIKPTVIYSVVELKGIRINVQYPQQIIAAKLQYFNKYGIQKHRDDLIAYFDIIKNGYKQLDAPIHTSNSIDDDLPF